MPYAIARHFQRYEYIAETGYLDNKNVLDIGCGYGCCTSILRYFARHVVGVDPVLKGVSTINIPAYTIPGKKEGCMSFIGTYWEEIGRDTKADVVTAVELIEHLSNPEEFLDFVAQVAPNLFLTTPLAEKTAPTDNPEHVKEYSHEDLVSLVNKRFDILETKYQLGNLRIVDEAAPSGSSLNVDHVVQMMWCKRKEAKQ